MNICFIKNPNVRSRSVRVFIFAALFCLIFGSSESFGYKRRGPPPPTSAQTKAFLELSGQLNKAAVELEKLKHVDGKADLPSVSQHSDLSDDEKSSMATEVKTILEDVESKVGSENLHSDHVKMLKDKIEYYKKHLSTLNIPTNATASKSKKKKGKT